MNAPKVMLVCGDCGVIPTDVAAARAWGAYKHVTANPSHVVGVYVLDMTVSESGVS